MQVSVTKREKESNERVISRFTKTVQASRKIPAVRGKRYHSKADTKVKVRAGAVKREEYRAKRARRSFY